MRPYHALPVEDVYSSLKTGPDGLSQEEAAKRLTHYGPNILRQEPATSPLRIFLQQFANPAVWILIAAMAVSAYIDEMISVYTILAIVLLNAILGFTQEYRAEKAIANLRKLLSLRAHVIRGGEPQEIDAVTLVPGDIIILETGAKIGADCRIAQASNFRVEQSALTGESMPVTKTDKTVSERTAIADRSSMVYAGTVVTGGRSRAIVTGTNMETELGRIAKLIQETAPEPTPLQRKLAILARHLGILVVALAIIMFLAGTARGLEWHEMLLTAIALAVAAIPEGLPAVVTTALAIGVQRMARRNALMRKLPSVETLGACTVICSDKTGTFTHNQMTVRKLFVNDEVVDVTGSGYTPEGKFSCDPTSFEALLRIGALNNNAQLHKHGNTWEAIGDPTEAALLVSARKAGIDPSTLAKRYARSREIEFTSERKCMTTLHTAAGKSVAYTKGAPEVVLRQCSKLLIGGRVVHLTKDQRERILAQNEKFANDALRVLGFAYKDLDSGSSSASPKEIEKDLVFVGLQAMLDPPRQEARAAVRTCKEAGITVIMITGDHLTTAVAIAKELGIEGKAITGEDLEHVKDLDSQIDTIRVYARVDPIHKLKIVEALKRRGNIVAMTGDGVNDAPALKRADIGIAMGISGTDVAKDASAMVLVDDNFASIVRAVEEGRIIFDNIKKFVEYLLSSNTGEVLTLFCAIIFGLPLPILPLQILWINLVTDGLPALALGVDPPEPDVMQRKPARIDEHIVNKRRGIIIALVGAVMTVITLGIFMVYEPSQQLSLAQTMAFTTLMLLQMFNVLNQRSESKSLFTLGIFGNKWLWGAIGLSVAMQALVVHLPFFNTVFSTVPLTLMQWTVSIGAASLILFFMEGLKLLWRRG